MYSGNMVQGITARDYCAVVYLIVSKVLGGCFVNKDHLTTAHPHCFLVSFIVYYTYQLLHNFVMS